MNVSKLVESLVKRNDIGELEIRVEPGHTFQYKEIIKDKKGLPHEKVRYNVEDHCDLRVLLVTPKPFILLTTSRYPRRIPMNAKVEELSDD